MQLWSVPVRPFSSSSQSPDNTSLDLQTTLITAVNLTLHATHYQVPAQQRQAMRILMMPTVYSVVSFCSYRYFRFVVPIPPLRFILLTDSSFFDGRRQGVYVL